MGAFPAFSGTDDRNQGCSSTRLNSYQTVIRLFLALVLLLCLAPGLHAETLSWSDLGSERQRVLGLSEEQWQQLPPERQERLRRGADRWLSMSPAERRLAKKNQRIWSRMTAEEREYIKRKYKEFQQLPKEKREQVVRLKKWFDGLPPERRKKILKRWRQAKDRDAFLEKGLERVR